MVQELYHILVLLHPGQNQIMLKDLEMHLNPLQFHVGPLIYLGSSTHDPSLSDFDILESYGIIMPLYAMASTRTNKQHESKTIWVNMI